MDESRGASVTPAAAEPGIDRSSGWPDDTAPIDRPSRLPARPWRLLLSALIGFFGTHGVLLAVGAFGLPTLLLFIVLGAGAAAVDARRSAFLALWLGATVYFGIMTTLYLGTRPNAEAEYDVLAPAIVVVGSALVALLAGSGYLLHRLLRDSTRDRTIDG